MKISRCLLFLCALLFAAQITVAGTGGAMPHDSDPGLTSGEDRSIVFLAEERSFDNAEDYGMEDDVGLLFDVPLFPSKSSFDLDRKMTFGLQTEEETEEETGAVASVATGGKRLNPGRAMMMSAAIPGAGEFYAGYNMDSPMITYIKAGVFFAAEVGFWYGGITYQMRSDNRTEHYNAYADHYWSEDVYRGYEYWLAQYFNLGSSKPTFQQDYPQDYTREDFWRSLPWDEKLEYLPHYFTHELPEEQTQQYYEMIFKYLSQFGAGWEGSHDDLNETDPDPFYEAYLLQYHNNQKTYSNPIADRASDIHDDINRLGAVSHAFFMAILVNHVASALDAGFTVRLHNRSLARAELGMDVRHFNGQDLVMSGIKVKF